MSASSKGRAIVGALAATAIVAARRANLRWGSTAAERRADLPGDAIVTDPDIVATRAITIRAPADRIWPWIAQLGQDRGGFYSYDRLENLVGCDIHNASRIVPEWQHVAVGDAVRLHPEVALSVVVLEPGRALVLGGGVPMGPMQPPYISTWAFVLDEQTDGTTRLVVRERYAFTRWWAPVLLEPVVAISWLMTQKMLREIRERVERDPSADAGSAPACP